MAKKKKYYTVWAGREPGVYDDWDDAFEQINGFPGARFKSFESPQAAAEAFRTGPDADARSLGRLLIGASAHTGPADEADRLLRLDRQKRSFPEIDPNAWAVDASCLGNPGRMEYQCIDLATGRQVFHFGPVEPSTNNIGEFLAIVHAISLMAQLGERRTIYSDSRIAMGWVKRRKCKTTLTGDKGNAKVTDLIARAERWLINHPGYDTTLRKWQTELWGEIPADFGRK